MLGEVVSSAAAGLYQAALDASLWPMALDEVARITGGAGMVIYPAGARMEGPFVYVSANMIEAAAAYQDGWIDTSPRLNAMSRRGLRNTMVEDAQLFTPEEIRRSAFHQELLRPFDCGSMIGVETPEVRPGVNYLISSQRAYKSRPPEPLERKLFAILCGHLVRALQVYRRLASVGGGSAALSDAFDRLACGALILDEGGQVLMVNAVADGMIGNGFSVRQGRLAAAMAADQTGLDRLVLSALASGPRPQPPEPIALRRQGGQRPLVLQAIPLLPDTGGPLGPLLADLARVLVLIVDPEQDTPLSAAKGLKLLGLTETEARIASRLGAGWSPLEIADHEIVLISTVRFHIKNIYSKLGLRRHGELTRIVQSLALIGAGGAD